MYTSCRCSPWSSKSVVTMTADLSGPSFAVALQGVDLSLRVLVFVIGADAGVESDPPSLVAVI